MMLIEMWWRCLLVELVVVVEVRSCRAGGGDGSACL